MANTELVNKLPVKYRWSHRHPLHRTLVKVYNRALWCVPYPIKYALGKSRRAGQFPYKLITPGSTVVQIGAPIDTLAAGRSRGLYFSLFAGNTGKSVIIEPAEVSETRFTKIAKKLRLTNLHFVRLGAWDEKKTINLYIDPEHPATNFTEGTIDYDDERIAQFEKHELPCDTVDNILADLGIEKVDLLSITANGAEVEILEGMKKTIDAGLKYICLALHTHRGDFEAMMAKYGFKPYAYDDRGITYSRIDADFAS